MSEVHRGRRFYRRGAVDRRSTSSYSSGDMNLRYWRASLVAGAAVIGVVALLLTALARTAERIETGVAAIWQVGKLIANNTVHIPLLIRTNQIAAEILQAAGGVGNAVERIAHSVSRAR